MCIYIKKVNHMCKGKKVPKANESDDGSVATGPRSDSARATRREIDSLFHAERTLYLKWAKVVCRLNSERTDEKCIEPILLHLNVSTLSCMHPGLLLNFSLEYSSEFHKISRFFYVETKWPRMPVIHKSGDWAIRISNRRLWVIVYVLLDFNGFKETWCIVIVPCLDRNTSRL